MREKSEMTKTQIHRGDLGEYELLITDDQSPTLISHYFNEACHSTSGARLETLHNYLEPCQVLQTFQSKKALTILEVGLGLGVGVKTTFEFLAANAQSPTAKVHYIALELDPGLVALAQEFCSLAEASAFPSWKDLRAHEGGFYGEKNGHQLTILLGDARETLPRFAEKTRPTLDVIYQDAFSPKRNPELWTLEWFELLKMLGHSRTRLSTYSASQSVRKAMIQAGLAVRSFPGFAQKREGTLALWEGKSEDRFLPYLENSKIEVLRGPKLSNF